MDENQAWTAAADTAFPADVAAKTIDNVAAAKTQDGRSQRWNEHREQRRAAIVAAGLAAIDDLGIDVGVHQIAKQANVSRTVLYRYFRDKDDLTHAIAQQMMQDVVATITGALESEDTPQLMIKATVSATIDWVAQHPRLYLFARRRTNFGDGMIERIESSVAASIGGLLQTILTMLGGDRDVSFIAAYAIVGLVENTLSWWIVDRQVPQEMLVETLYEFIEDAIQGYLRRAGIELDLGSALPSSVFVDIK